MARKPSLEKRTNKPQICFSDSELTVAERNAREARMTLSEWGRFRMAEVQPMRLKPTPEAEEMLKGLAAVQQISKNLDLLAKEGNVSDEILMMVRTELMAAGQLISKGLK